MVLTQQIECNRALRLPTWFLPQMGSLPKKASSDQSKQDSKQLTAGYVLFDYVKFVLTHCF